MIIIENTVLPEKEEEISEILNNWSTIIKECLEKNYILDLTKPDFVIIVNCFDLNFVKKVEEFLLGGKHKFVKDGVKIM